MACSARKVSVAAGLVLAVLGSSRASAEVVRVPGTNTSLQPPNGFLLADRFPGFHEPEQGTAIVVTEMPAPAAEIIREMTADRLARKGMKLISSKAERIEGRDGLLLQVAQSVSGIEFLKWILVTGDQKTSVMIAGSFPKDAEDRIGAALRGALLSASWKSGALSSHFEGLSFRVTPTARLKVAGRLSNMLMLTESGSMGPHGPAEPVYIVGTSLDETRVGDLRSFSEARIKRFDYVKDIKNFQRRDIRIDGLAAHELLADARDLKSEQAMRLYQVIAADGVGYVIVQGLVVAERASELIAEFRRVTASFRRATHESRPTRR